MWPHPESDPAGHSYGHREAPAAPLTEADWRDNATWLWAADLFNHGYYWEAHEAWESLWHAAGRHGEVADLLKGLIKLAASGVKAREGRAAGVRLHAARARELLAPSRGSVRFGLSADELLAAMEGIKREPEQLLDTSRAAALRVLPVVIRLAD
jgi:hypothetical protein